MLVADVFIYLLFAFVMQDFRPSYWSIETRTGLACVIGVVMSIIGMAVPMFDADNNSEENY